MSEKRAAATYCDRLALHERAEQRWEVMGGILRQLRSRFVAIVALIVTIGGSLVGVLSNATPAAAATYAEGVPYTKVNLGDGGRPTINAAFLSDTVGGVPRAKFEAVVLPNDNP